MKVDELLVEAVLDDSKFKSGVRGIVNDLKETKAKTEESGIEFMRMGAIIGGVAGIAAVFTKGLLDGLLGLLTSSPQVKEFLGNLQEPFFRLSNFLGQTFKPVFQEMEAGIKGFIGWFTSDPGVKGLLDLTSKTGVTTLQFAFEFPEIPAGGLIALLAAKFGVISWSQAGLVVPLLIEYELVKKAMSTAQDITSNAIQAKYWMDESGYTLGDFFAGTPAGQAVNAIRQTGGRIVNIVLGGGAGQVV